MIGLRPMVEQDVEECQMVCAQAFADSRSRLGLMPVPAGVDDIRRESRRMLHLVRTDPAGGWVATADGRVVGVAQSIRRDRLWVLSLLGVDVTTQGRGIGTALFERALRYRRPGDAGLILCSPDPRAARVYAKGGFFPHPTVSAVGQVRRTAAPITSVVRRGGWKDRGLVDRVDRQVRGAAHGPDLDHLLDHGCGMLVIDDRGYAIVGAKGPLILAALDDDAARLLLSAALTSRAGRTVAVHWLTCTQAWAIEVAVEAGLELRPRGPLMLDGAPGPLVPYLPSGAFG